jgi:restriction system protein
MEFHEYPLLSYADLMLTILTVASRESASLADCLDHLRHTLDRAHEHPPVSAEEMHRRLATAQHFLLAAKLLTSLEDERFRITERGRRVLADNPMGVDDTVLMQFPEFRALIGRAGEPVVHDDPRPQEYEEGYEAYQAGKLPADNPYEFDRIEHLAWENGWFGARDDALELEQT